MSLLKNKKINNYKYLIVKQLENCVDNKRGKFFRNLLRLFVFYTFAPELVNEVVL